MPGFLISNIGKSKLDNCFNNKCLFDEFEFDEFYCARNTLNRFLGDKCFIEDDEYIAIAEGVVFNKRELFNAYSCHDMGSLIRLMYEDLGEVFFDKFRGPFSGALYDKRLSVWVVYTSHYGDNPVFYYYDNGSYVFASQVNYILEALSKAAISISLNEKAVYMMLSYAYMIDESTYANEIKRLRPGTYAVIDSENQLEIRQYYRPKERSVDISNWDDQMIINKIDCLFREAAEREYRKDEEYDYNHLSDLSGGLDSRMTAWVADDLGFKKSTNLTYCQSGYIDQIVASQIANDLGNSFVFYALDDAEFIFNAKRIVGMNYGLSVYSGITGGEMLLGSLDIEKFGIEHTGQLGDVVVGSFLNHEHMMKKIEHAGAYSSKYLKKLEDPNPAEYRDREQYLFELRAFLGALSTHMIRRNYTEVGSPFLDVDLIEFCLSVPISKRKNHEIYKKWIITKYPKAADYIWEKEGIKVNASILRQKLNKLHGYFRMIEKMILKRPSKKSSMNPFEYWYDTNPKVKRFIDDAIYEYGKSIPFELREEIEKFYKTANTLEKTQALTVLCAYDYYFDDGYKEHN